MHLSYRISRALRVYLCGENLNADRTPEVFSFGARGVALFAAVRVDLRYRRVFVSDRCDFPVPALYTLLMGVRLHPHALERLAERGATEEDIRLTVAEGEQFPAKYGRTGFRRNFPFKGIWNSRYYTNKQVEAYAVEEQGWLVITVMVKFF